MMLTRTFPNQQTFFGLIVGAENIAKTAPFLESFASARGSATSIFRVVDRSSKIDSMSSSGKTLNFSVQGNIAFKNVHFSYPSRPDVQVWKKNVKLNRHTHL